jgi:hypothetical protein
MPLRPYRVRCGPKEDDNKPQVGDTQDARCPACGTISFGIESLDSPSFQVGVLVALPAICLLRQASALPVWWLPTSDQSRFPVSSVSVRVVLCTPAADSFRDDSSDSLPFHFPGRGLHAPTCEHPFAPGSLTTGRGCQRYPAATMCLHCLAYPFRQRVASA